MFTLRSKDPSKIESVAREIFTEQAASERDRASGNRSQVYQLVDKAEGAARSLLSALNEVSGSEAYRGDIAEVRGALDGIRLAAERPDIVNLNGEFHPAAVLDVTSRHADALEGALSRLRHAVTALSERIAGIREMNGQIGKLNENIRRLQETAEELAPKADVYVPSNLARKREESLEETRRVLDEKKSKLSRKEAARGAVVREGIGGVEVTQEDPPQVVLEVLNDVRRRLREVNVAELSPRDAQGKYASVYDDAKGRIDVMTKREQRDNEMHMSRERREHVASLGPKSDALIAHHDAVMATKREEYLAHLDSLYAVYLAKLAGGGKQVSSAEYNRMVESGYTDIDRKNTAEFGVLYKRSSQLIEMLPESLEDILILIDLAQQKIQKRLVALIEGKKKAEAKMTKTGKKGDLHEICADIRVNTQIYRELERLRTIGHMSHPIQSITIASSNAIAWLMSFVRSGEGQTA